MTSTTRRCDELVILNIGDGHFGHPNTPTPHILSSLYALLPDNAETAKINIIVWTGDVFDRLLNLIYEYVFEIKQFIKYLLMLCKKYDILLRILEGTPRHDNKQSALFDDINEIAEIGADLKYVKTLSIEYIERYGISVLYVPDEVNHEPETTLRQVHDLLKAKGLTQVDYAAMHGQFDFQLPPHVTAPKHDSQAYLKIVKRVIWVGHVHTPMRFDRIHGPGSVDRLHHGEEEPKGILRFTMRPDEYTCEFIENKNAKKYVTVDCTGLEMAELIEKVDNVVRELPDFSFVRVSAESSHPVFSNMQTLINRHPKFTWSKLAKEQKEREIAEEGEDEEVYRPIFSLTKDNLAELLLARVAALSPHAVVMAAAQEILKRVM